MKGQVFTQMKVGFFVVIGILIAMIIVFEIGSESKLFKRQYHLYTRFADISGLRVGAVVQLAGVKAGAVDRIMMPKELDEKLVTLRLRIDKKYQDRVREDSVATVNTSGLLGDKYVNISIGTSQGNALENGALLKSEETTPIFALAEKAGKIMDDIASASRSLSDLLSTVGGEKKGGDVKATLGSLRKSVEEVEKGRGLLHALIYDEKGQKMMDDISSTFKAIKQITGGVEKGSEKEMEGMLTNLRKSSADLKEIISAVRRGEGTLGKLVRDPELYNDLRLLLGKSNKNMIVREVVRSTVEERKKEEQKREE